MRQLIPDIDHACLVETVVLTVEVPLGAAPTHQRPEGGVEASVASQPRPRLDPAAKDSVDVIPTPHRLQPALPGNDDRKALGVVLEEAHLEGRLHDSVHLPDRRLEVVVSEDAVAVEVPRLVEL